MDPEIQAAIDGLEQRLTARIDIVNARLDEVLRLTAQLGAFDNSTHAELVAIKRRVEKLES